MRQSPLPGIVVLISGSGTNLQALIDAVADGRVHGEIRAVISNQPEVTGLDRARRAGIPAQVINHRDFSDRSGFDQALMAAIDRHQPELVVLAGFMRVLTPAFVEHYDGHLINIHPSLLPDFRGLHTHERALEAGVQQHGCSIHFVNTELDGGPVILQARVPVLIDDTPQTLAARVQQQEHRAYPQVVQWFCQGRLTLRNGQVWLDEQPLQAPLQLSGPAVLADTH
ncbi:phosphoribosylglycinamide formyltransferase [Ectothiorhodospira lacustris]|uniref:phosphoribosylglycinamide formyltransferase n=1 Tax=Ectothiorhodospira lacustris TaxID=2899127 RepID=UPI001EE8B361|nr:phosphoribosylglycinamide formyltransferase [Ectothiorhodospira lacustris]MCG5500632.1 phosphoribosylglycinamide formyltransferase [Ectothiorhodospira lacustris]MCG5508941.1 phosphoribosylglycinamide formyltransferase [Ectothiorhodospira lacustris]MCG5520732.1 phosphoribosylglycinamide formyltransferase [Ectothiorhodospira lacustris]